MLFIFDWDGTLIDSTDKIASSMQKAIAELDLPFRTIEESKSIIGLSLAEAGRALFPGLEESLVSQLSASYSQHFLAADQTPCDFYPSVERVLRQLREEGHQLAVATGKSRRGLERVWANLEMTGFFDASRCADETASKPDPLMLNQLLAECECSADESLMIGDTSFDLEMAQRAGIDSVGVTYGAHPKKKLLPYKPRCLIDDFAELLNVSTA
jgi:phosphoglycolate phosphatase